MITASAPGKINLHFAVGPKLENGYHEVCSVYLALELREKVSAKYSNELSIAVSGDLSKAQLDSVPTDESNLVVKAGRLVTDRPIAFEIEKHIPVAGGMGGGSADAAAALVAVNRLVGFSEQLDPSVLGADVPFSVLGGAALGTGVGDLLKPIPVKGAIHVVLITSEHKLSTPVVYSKLDELRVEADLIPSMAPLEPSEMLTALREGNIAAVARLAQNDLQWAAIELLPELQDTIDRAKAAGALNAMVSGSGPTIFALAESLEAAKEIAKVFGDRAIVTSGPAGGARLES